MTSEQVVIIEEHLTMRGYDCRVDLAYSGRGMYGKTCAAIITDDSLVRITAEIGWLFAEKRWLPITLPDSWDSMGMGWVIY